MSELTLISKPLSSSKFFPPEINLTYDSSGYANQSSVEASWGKFGWWLCDGGSDSNPDFFGFNHVWVPYCSQDLWSGRQTNWTKYVMLCQRLRALTRVQLDRELERDVRGSLHLQGRTQQAGRPWLAG
eukprot:745819-Hanusia_phi.AAC.2